MTVCCNGAEQMQRRLHIVTAQGGPTNLLLSLSSVGRPPTAQCHDVIAMQRQRSHALSAHMCWRTHKSFFPSWHIEGERTFR